MHKTKGVKQMLMFCPKSNVGPGGWRCSCCAHAHPTRLKRRFNKTVRRNVRQWLKNEKRNGSADCA